MDIGIGLPNAVPGTDGKTLIGWARSADEAGFSSLGTIGRIVYPSYEELIALSAAAAVTSRIRLTSAVLIAPLYANTALLAKQVASLDRLSGGRVVLGVGLGGRDDDYSASGVPMAGRGRHLDEQLAEMRRIWSGEKLGYAGGIGPEPVRQGGPELICAATTPATFGRVARFADGWIMAGGSPDMFAGAAAHLDEIWQAAGRSGKPRKLAMTYFALGPDADAQADAYIPHFYDWDGDLAGYFRAGTVTSAEMARSMAAAFAAGGCDELIFDPTGSDPGQLRLLAEAVL
jgi:alkanesulfonate monooxygenase SsuD/methylene tetrahydromethanopterin reductase-like flavin-dependent oxidoreductase (luciferase family)